MPNARKKNYTQDKLDKKLELANEGIEEYLDKLDRGRNGERCAAGAGGQSGPVEQINGTERAEGPV